ncbi:MAG: tetratricopeptide repeat protein [Nitrospira sp.]|nr:tetratricopeptide repeat protein [Nitrospira sp.]MCP9465066.1 tetratricopeptide repeat protein [Nitrospira sp.]
MKPVMGMGRGKRQEVGRWGGAGYLLAGVGLLGSVLGGCAATEEEIRKSQGYYQEGLATLPGDRQRAFVSFQKAVQLNPNNKEARYALGHVYAMQGKLTKAEEEFRAAIKIDEDYSEAHTYLGQILASQSRWDEAIKSYRRALANPLYVTPDLAWFHLGRALAQKGDLQAAMEAFEDALTTSPPSVPPAMTHLELAQVYIKLGYVTKAREALKQVELLDQKGEYAAVTAELLARLK